MAGKNVEYSALETDDLKKKNKKPQKTTKNQQTSQTKKNHQQKFPPF